MAEQISPVFISDDGRDYLCVLDFAAIPDGAQVSLIHEGDVVTGVMARADDGTVLHACGKLDLDG